jgi:hypothetical protein
MRPAREYRIGERTAVVYEMGEGGPAAELHVLIEPGAAPASQGAGGVHHVAFRIPDADYEAWADRLQQTGVPSSGPVDRFYFRSLYFASRTASCSRSRPTGQALRPTSRWRASARSSRSRPSWRGGAPTSSAG